MVLEQCQELLGTGLSGHDIEGFLLFPERDRGHEVVEVPFQVGTDRVLGRQYIAHAGLQRSVFFRLEQFREDGSPDFFVSGQQFPELPLGDHDDLHELVSGEAQQFFDRCRHFPDLAGDGRPVPVEQDR